MSGFLDFTESVHNNSQQEVEQNHEDQKLKGPEEEGCSNSLQALQQLEVIVHADVTQQDGEAGIDCCAKCGKLLQHMNNGRHASEQHDIAPSCSLPQIPCQCWSQGAMHHEVQQAAMAMTTRTVQDCTGGGSC